MVTLVAATQVVELAVWVDPKVCSWKVRLDDLAPLQRCAGGARRQCRPLAAYDIVEGVVYSSMQSLWRLRRCAHREDFPSVVVFHLQVVLYLLIMHHASCMGSHCFHHDASAASDDLGNPVDGFGSGAETQVQVS